MTIHPQDFRSDIRVAYTLDHEELSAFHVTIRPIVMELIAVPDSTYRWSLLHQLRRALGKLYRHERLSDHRWHHGRQIDSRRTLERERWNSLDELDRFVARTSADRVDETELFLFLSSLGRSEYRKLELGRPAESIGSHHFG